MPYDFKHITDFIFKNKENYSKLSHKDKEDNFFIINRKFCRQYPVYAQMFNNKNIDKSIAMDLWFNFINKKRIIGVPNWYWFKLGKKKEKTFLKKEEKEFLTTLYNISEKDIEFLVKYYPDDVKLETKKFRKLNKN